MATKRPSSPSIVKNILKNWKTITFSTKIDIIKRFESGKRAVDIANHYCLTTTAIITIKSNARKIKASVQNISVTSSNKINGTRNPLMENMEKMLCLWIQDQNQRRMPVSLNIVQFKAKSLFNNPKKENSIESHNIEFNASRGSFKRLKNRLNFHTIRVTGKAVIR